MGKSEQQSQEWQTAKLQTPAKGMSRYDQVCEQIAKLQQEKREIEQRRRAEERKARTRRLIEIGALTLQHFNVSQDIEPAAFAVLLHQMMPAQGDGSVVPPPQKTEV